MHGGTRILFEDHISVEGSSSVSFATSPEHNVWLAHADRLVLQGHYQLIKGAGPTEFKLVLQTSSDGVRWSKKQEFWNLTGSPRLAFTGDTWGAEPEVPNPSMGQARAVITISSDESETQNVYLLRILATHRSRTKRVAREAVGRIGTTRPRTPFTEATMQEMYRHLLDSADLHAGERAHHVLSRLSAPARREVETFTRNIVGMDPAVKGSIADFASALVHLMKAPAPGPGGPPDDLVARAFDSASREPLPPRGG